MTKVDSLLLGKAYNLQVGFSTPHYINIYYPIVVSWLVSLENMRRGTFVVQPYNSYMSVFYRFSVLYIDLILLDLKFMVR